MTREFNSLKELVKERKEKKRERLNVVREEGALWGERMKGFPLEKKMKEEKNSFENPVTSIINALSNSVCE